MNFRCGVYSMIIFETIKFMCIKLPSTSMKIQNCKKGIGKYSYYKLE